MRSLLFSLLSVAALIAAALPREAVAYNPPTDKAGPLAVRIEGPAEITRPGAVAVCVRFDSAAEEPIAGTLRLVVIDGWKVEPAGPAAFHVEGKGTSSREFRVLVDDRTYNAHYPIHAFVRFDHAGRAFEAHPILVVETNLPEPPRAEPPPVEWKPAKAPADGKLNLWQLDVHRSVVEVFRGALTRMPPGWRGSEPESRASLRFDDVSLDGVRRGVVAMHPPWHEGRVGTIFVEFPLALPDVRPIKLRFAHAVAADHRGDGVTFRVRVAAWDAPAGQPGEIVFERHSDAKTWQPAEADLSRYAGATVRLQLESHPGPDLNTAFDQSYWAEPTLVAGTPPGPPVFPPESDKGSRVLGIVGRGVRGEGRGASSAAAPSPEIPKSPNPEIPTPSPPTPLTLAGEGSSAAGREDAAAKQLGDYEVRLWPGRRGLLDAAVGFRRGEKLVAFRGFEVRVAGSRLDQPGSPMLLKSVTEERIPGGLRVRHRFEGPRAAFDLVGELCVERGALLARFALEDVPPPRPWQVVYLEGVACGPWSLAAERVYAGHGNVVVRPGPFFLNFDGHRLATSLVGFDFEGAFSVVQGVDVPPDGLDVRPADRSYSLRTPHASTMTLIPAGDVFEAVKVWRDLCGLKPSAGVEKLAGRFVFDLWGGRYADGAEALKQAFRYGLTDSLVIWHNWQRWGYDYRLPDIYPPNPQFGTLEEFPRLAETCRRSGVLFAPHDNYIDFYPDAEGFSYERRIAFDAEGRPVKAWLNEHRGARSYRFRADQVEPFLARNLRLLRDGFAPDAFFIDVWSSINPYDYWTADGKFCDRVYTRDSWGRHFAWIRRFLGGDAPQISESGHDQLIGYLDGATANHLRVGQPLPGRYSWSVWNWSCDDAQRIPWIETAYHDRFILHGAGYSSRYEAGLDPRLHGIYSDDYIATEVLCGRPAMVPVPFGRDVVRKYWLTQELARALALQTIEGVEFVGGDIHRQRVAWSGGGEVWVNRGPGDWQVEGHVLPEFGFLARVPTDGGTVEASIARREGGIVTESVRSPSMVYVNGRRPLGGPHRIRATVERVRPLGARQFEMTLAWQAEDPVPNGYRPFLHFVDPQDPKGDEGIVFQPGLDAAALRPGATGSLETTARGALPAELPAGSALELRIGFYRPEGGQRLELVGPDDGSRRVPLGTLRFEGERDGAAALSWKPAAVGPDPFLARQNPEGVEIDFGAVATAGACRITREGGALVVTPLPATSGPAFRVLLRLERLPWNVVKPTTVERLDADGRTIDRRPLAREAGAVLIECLPGDFAYRLSGGDARSDAP